MEILMFFITIVLAAVAIVGIIVKTVSGNLNTNRNRKDERNE